MKTKLKTAHEESYSDSDKTLGVLLNYSFEVIDKNWKESFLYIYKEGLYIFFDTIINMIDYLLYGDTKIRRAYMEEEEFDDYYDAQFIDGTFTDLLKWTN